MNFVSGFILRGSFLLEVVLAELIFLYPTERKSRFPMRLAIVFLALLLVAIFLNLGVESVLAQLVLFIGLFALTVLGMGFCFQLSPSALISSCVAGYAVEHIAFHIVKIAMACGFMQGLGTELVPQRILAEAALFPALYLLALVTIGFSSARLECWKYTDLRFNYLSFVIIFICIGLTRVASVFQEQDSVTVSLYAITACLMSLEVQLVLSRAVALRYENETVNLLWQEERKQYALSKKTIDTINIKYHDLKHTLRGMNLPREEADTIKSAVRVYGSRIRTGNEALDVLLTENSLRCNEEGISLTYMGDGAALSFMSVVDVYALFGNAVSNAVEAVERLDDPEKKLITINTEAVGSMISVTIANYYADDLVFEDGIPHTTKRDEEGFHGFGLKSMRLICEKYGGNLSCTAQEEVFTLSLYLMNTDNSF